MAQARELPSPKLLASRADWYAEGCPMGTGDTDDDAEYRRDPRGLAVDAANDLKAALQHLQSVEQARAEAERKLAKQLTDWQLNLEAAQGELSSDLGRVDYARRYIGEVQKAMSDIKRLDAARGIK